MTIPGKNVHYLFLKIKTTKTRFQKISENVFGTLFPQRS